LPPSLSWNLACTLSLSVHACIPAKGLWYKAFTKEFCRILTY
jgi:hypothetical protein